MHITEKQHAIAVRMIIGGLVSLLIIPTGYYLYPFVSSVLLAVPTMQIAAISSLVPILFLIISIARLAKHRFFSPEDIDGGGLSMGTERAKMLHALLQNTLEQAVISISLYIIWGLLMPTEWILVLPLAALCFGVGRLLFFTGYEKGAPARALGFTLCFYPTIIMLATLIAVTIF